MQDSRIVGIIQARMGSSRLPGKMMKDLCGYPVLQWVIERCKRSSGLDEIVLATTTDPEDDVLIVLAKEMGIRIFRGSVEDVLERFVAAAQYYKATIVVRICADNPLVAPEEIDRLIEEYLKKEPDYAFNHIPKRGGEYPDGLGAEILSLALLEKIREKAQENRYREHVTSYIWDNADLFHIKAIECPKPYNDPFMKLDIDTESDLAVMCNLCKTLSFQSTPSDIYNAWLLLRSKSCF